MSYDLCLLIFVWIPPFSVMISRSIHAARDGVASLVLVGNVPSGVYTASPPTPVRRHGGYFRGSATARGAAVNTGGRVSFQIVIFSGRVPRSGTAGPYGSSIFSF